LFARVLIAGASALSFMTTACGGDNSVPASASSPTTGSIAATPSANAVVAALQKHEAPPDLIDGFSLGKKDASVTLAVFEDFQCPHCLRYTALFEPAIVDEYVKAGKVRVEFHQLPILGDESVQAATASWCAGQQGQFWSYHRKLFLLQAEADQLTAEKIGVGRFSAASLKAVAAGLGVDPVQFDACYGGDAAMEAVRADVRQAQALGLRGTPSFVLNGKPLASGSPATIAGWRKLLDDALAGR